MYTIERMLDNRWTRDAVGIAENEFATEEEAQNVIDELRQHAEWTMAQFRISAS